MDKTGKGVVILDLETDGFSADVAKRAAQVVAAHGFTLSIRQPDGTYQTLDLDGSLLDDQADDGCLMPTHDEMFASASLTSKLDHRQIERIERTMKRQAPLPPAQDPAFYRRFERRGRDGRVRR